MTLQRQLFPTTISIALVLVMLAGTNAVARPPGTTAVSGQSGFRVLSGHAARDYRLPSDMRLVLTWRDAAHGLTYTRYQQYATGNAAVDGAEITVVQRAGSTVLVAGTHHSSVVPTNRLVVSSSGAIARAVAAPAVQGAPPLRDVPAPALESRTQLMLDPTTGRLFQRVESGSPGVYVIHDVDAETGAITAAWNALDNATPGMGTGVRGDRKSLLGEEPNPADNLTTQVSGVWKMQSADGRMVTMDAKGSYIFYSGTPILTDNGKTKWKNDNDWAGAYQRAAVDAQYYARFTDDWYRDPSNVGGFDFVSTDCVGPDPALGTIRNVVHYDEPPFTGYVNAFWDGFSKFMVYGDGNGVTATYMSGGQDVVSHELTHAVTQCRAPLQYQNQSGALNEAMSDIMATTMEWQMDEPLSSNCRRDVGQTGCPDWWVGEDVLIGGTRFGFRNIENPGVTGQPGHWQDRCTGCASDNGGVHINSTIVTHAFYLMVNGGRNARCSGPTDTDADCDVLVPAIPMSDASQILFAAWGLLTTNATFCDAHDASVGAARTMFPSSDLHLAAVDLAFSAVGRGSSDCAPADADFTVGVSKSSVALAPGTQGSLTINLVRGASFDQGATSIEYAVSGGSSATITVTPGESMGPGPDDSAVVEVTVPPAMPEGAYPLVVSASHDSTIHYAGLMLIVDASAPTVGLASVRFADGGTVSASNPGTVLLNVGWSAADALSGVASSQLERSPNGTNSWTVVSTATGGGSSQAIVGDAAQWFQVSATDAVGNSAVPALSGPWTIGRYQEIAATYKSTWSALPASQTWGSVRYSSTPGATAKFAFTGSDVAWVSTRATNRGKAKVYIDGVLKTTVDLFAISTQARRIVFTATDLAAGPHTLKIVVSGTNGRPRIDIDGFLTLSPPTF